MAAHFEPTLTPHRVFPSMDPTSPAGDASALLIDSGGRELQLEIGPANLVEAEQILKLQFLCYQSEANTYGDHAIPPLTETLADLVSRYDCGRIIVVRAGGEVIGAVRTAARGRTCEIGRLIVHPRFQRRGLGSQLLTAAEASFPSANRYELFTGKLSHANIAFYTRRGYRLCRERTASVDGPPIVFLEKLSASFNDEDAKNYAAKRSTDPTIMAAIESALGPARSVVNVGAGTGSYEPHGRTVLAVEPSAPMLRRRPTGAAAAVLGHAESLPLLDESFDAALSVLSIHHWHDQRTGMLEMRRVARDRVVVLTWDPTFARSFWLVDYIPQIACIGVDAFPSLEQFADWLGTPEITVVPVPTDCEDGFMGAYWCRAQAYLDASVRAAISLFASLEAAALESGLASLRRDIDDGSWQKRYNKTVKSSSHDLGYRILTWMR